jgi:hypothetical protein
MGHVHHVIDAKHVVARLFVQAPCLASSGVTGLLDSPLETTGILIRQLKKLLEPPERRHRLVDARHGRPEELGISYRHPWEMQAKLRIACFFLYIQLNDAACKSVRALFLFTFPSKLSNITPFSTVSYS